MKIKDCNEIELATMLKLLPLNSMQLGHANPLGTVRDYLSSNNSSPEIDFIIDLFTASTEEIIEKWYGAETNAGKVLIEIKNIQDPL